MPEVSSGLSAYQWTDYDKKIKTSESKDTQQAALKESLNDNKLTGKEIKDLKTNYREAFMKENPNESLDTADANFYEGLASTTGVTADKLRSADSSPVEFTFNITSNKIATITEDKNEDGDSEAATTKDGSEESAITAPVTKTPDGLKFKDYKTNNFNDAANVAEKKDNFAKGNVVTLKDEKVAAAIDEESSASPRDKIKTFQSSIGLSGKDVDGKFGPKTLSTLAEKYTEALNTNPPTDASKAEVERLGKIVDKLQPTFEGTKTGEDLKSLRTENSSSDKIETTKKGIEDRKFVLGVAKDLMGRGTEALKSNPPNYAEFKKVTESVKSSNLPEPVKAKVMGQLMKSAENKLTENIKSPPAKTLNGDELLNALPDGNASKDAFKAMYSSEVKDGKTKWTLKQPNDINESLKGKSPEVVSKALSFLAPKDAETILKKMEPRQAKEAVDNMKPENAAKIFDKMSPKEASSILIADGSDKSKTASIISAMQPASAKKLLEQTDKQFGAWTNAVKGQMTEDDAVKNLGAAITAPGEKTGTTHLDKINENSSPKAKAMKEAFTLLNDKSEKDGKVVWNPKSPPDKEKLNEFIKTPEFKQLSSDVQKFINDQIKPEEVKPKVIESKPAPTPIVEAKKPEPGFNVQISHLNPHTKTSDPDYFSIKINKKDIVGRDDGYNDANVKRAAENILRKQGKDPANYDIKVDWLAPSNSYNIEAKLKAVRAQ